MKDMRPIENFETPSAVKSEVSVVESVEPKLSLDRSELLGDSEQLSGGVEKQKQERAVQEKKAVEHVRDSLAELDIESSANFGGDWTLNFRDRLLDPETKRRFIECKRKYPVQLESAAVDGDNPAQSRVENISLFKKVDLTPEEVERAIAEYDSVVEKVFAQTRIGDARSEGKQPEHLGMSSGYGDPGIVYNDATSRATGEPLDARQKNIIEAHEKAHSVFAMLTASEKAQLNPLLRFGNKLKGYNNRLQAEEFLARMVQVKSYFGMSANERFTRSHLEHAKSHYVSDTKLDNAMTNFFETIEGNEDEAVEIFNEFPC